MNEFNAIPEAQVVADLVKALHKPQLMDLPSGDKVLLTPDGISAVSVKKLMDEYRNRPERREGTATLLSLDSFIEWTNRHKDEHSVVFANNDPTAPLLLAVIDYNEAGEDCTSPDDTLARFGRHRGIYRFPLSKAWQAWAKVDGVEMSQTNFAHFLEDRISDVLVPPKDGAKEADAKLLDLIGSFGGVLAGPSALLTLSRGLHVHETSKVKNVVNISTGEVQVVYETNHTDGMGQPLNVPTAFLIGIPVFENSKTSYRIPVRLRYRRHEGFIKWSLVRYRPEMIFDDAFAEAVERVRRKPDDLGKDGSGGGTGLPLFLGKPEGSQA